MYSELSAALRTADADEAVGAVVLSGRGTAFTSGQDLGEMAAIATGTAVEGAGRGFMGLLDCLTELSVPMLAAVNGPAVGLGFTLLAHCDLVLVAADARLRVPFAELGVPAEAASSYLFPATMGWQHAARILLTSDWVEADELVSLGLALQSCPPGTVLDETVGLAARIAAHPRAATRAITALMRAARREAVLEANRREQGAFATLLGAAAQQGALADFAAKTS
jgi:enoyl-CoA hydratase/carnithine racemase